jgi:glycosyltransferase involved in cell wall biosynthesis
MIKFSLILATWNGISVIKDCLEHIVSNLGADSEIFVIDNGSMDGTKEFIEKFSKDSKNFSFISLDKNYGSTVARNKGLAKATGEYIVEIDQDVLLLPDWKASLTYFDSPDVAAVGADALMWTSWRSMFGGIKAIPPVGSYIDAIQSNFWVFKNRGWRYDEQFFFCCDEIDLQLQMRQKGYRFKRCADNVRKHLARYCKEKNSLVDRVNKEAMPLLMKKWQGKDEELHFEK